MEKLEDTVTLCNTPDFRLCSSLYCELDILLMLCLQLCEDDVRTVECEGISM